MQKFQPGTPRTTSKHEDRLTELKAKMEAGKEQAEREIERPPGRDDGDPVQGSARPMVGWVAKQRGMTHVVKVAYQHRAQRQRPELGPGRGEPPGGLRRSRNDITNDVVYYLNRDLQRPGHGGSRADTAGQAAGRRSARQGRLLSADRAERPVEPADPIGRAGPIRDLRVRPTRQRGWRLAAREHVPEQSPDAMPGPLAPRRASGVECHCLMG